VPGGDEFGRHVQLEIAIPPRNAPEWQRRGRCGRVSLPARCPPCGTRTSGARMPRSVSPAKTSPFGNDGREASARTVDVA
jgi:hypothetical protein